MPPSSRYSRASSRSPTRSTSFMSTATSEKGPQPVKRLFITGKAQRKSDGEGDGAAIKMYLRMSISPTAVAPGDMIPLFPEDNAKILKATVHPLDSSFTPYSFSLSKHPELTKAVQVLNLPSRSRESYMSLFEGSLTSSPQSAGGNPYDKRYSGEILVSGYQVSYVLPKEFPPRIYASDNFSKRSANDMHFMAVIQLWVPYLSTPPHSPYHLALPVPKCLSNHIRLRIFPPVPTSSPLTSSMASLSSAEGDVISWEFRVEPHVATKPSKQLPRNNSYSSFADDESSDSSGSRSSGYSVRGSFPSTEHLRISWAVPKKVEDVPLTIDGRSRVGIRDVRSDMTCSVLRRNKGKARGRKDSGEDGIVMRVDYTATCRGVWFPGVATLLGMDLALEAEDCDVSWAPGEDNYWTIVGSAGYTGFSVGPQPKASASRKPTEDGPSTRVSTSPEKRRDYLAPTRLSTAEPASLSTASLLRAPLPSSPHPDELSFDESPNGTPVSSIGSLATMPSDPERGRSRASSAAREGRPTDSEPEDVVQQRPPKVPITIHLNMNELGPASQNEITIKVIGTIVLRPRENNAATFLASPVSSGSTGSDDEQEQSSAVMPIPQFHVLFTEQETISNIVLNESDMLSVDIYNSTGNITDAQSRKTVLQPGGKTKCGSDGGRFALRNASSNRSFLRRQDSTENMRRPASRSRPPSYIQRNASTASLYRERSYSINARPKRDGPLMIPSVSTTVTPLSRKGRLPTEYAVRIQLPAPSGTDSEWLEFGLALPEQPTAGGPEPAKAASGTEKKRRPPMVEVASASVGGVSVQFETSVAARPDSKLPALGLTFEETSAKEWITWVKIHVGDAGGGNVEIVYVVEDQSLAAAPSHTGWKFGAASRPRDEVRLNILLPTFFLPVGLMEVNVESLPKVECDIISNLDHQQTTSTGSKLLKYSLEEFFYPNLTLTMSSDRTSKTSSASSSWRMIGLILCMMPTAMALLAMAEKQAISAGLAQAHESLESCSIALQSPPSLPDPVTIVTTATTTATTTNFVTTTVTSTVYTPSSTQTKWRNKQNSVVNEESETASTSLTSRQSPINSLPTSVLAPTITTVLPPPSLPSPTSSDETEMADVRDMAFLWPTHLDLPALEIPETARITISKIWNGVGFVWHLFQKVLHYPLDPP